MALGTDTSFWSNFFGINPKNDHRYIRQWGLNWMNNIENRVATTGTDYSYAIKPSDRTAFISLLEKLRLKAGLTQTQFFNNYVNKYNNANQLLKNLKVRAFQIEP